MSQTEKHSVIEKKIFFKGLEIKRSCSYIIHYQHPIQHFLKTAIYVFFKVLNFLKILGFDMWYQIMVQTLGLYVAQLLSV